MLALWLDSWLVFQLAMLVLGLLVPVLVSLSGLQRNNE